MHRLSSIILLLGLTVNLFSQSPHGARFKVNCADCHSAAGWDIPYDAWDRTGPIFSKTTGWQIGWDTARFSHTKTDFPLTGKHIQVDCRACHSSMVFSDAGPECISCHQDMHNGTVGNDCARCHNTDSWLVDNIPELHQDNGFPLLGAHAGASCADCHSSETGLRFERIGNDCINCHRADYASTSSPSHQGAGFSTNCVDCHDVTRFDWTTDRVNHDFFPLTKGHDISDCARCHTTGSYSNTPSDCISCHKNDFETAVSPNHQSGGFSQNCIECHTTDPDWMPAVYTQHDAAYFPIYSGAHKGEWDACKDCHTNPSNYAEYTCVTCHMNPETDNQHNGVNGYSYNSPACLACHPTGSANDGFDHNNTGFPLTGAHITTACVSCHASGYAGTPTDCASCHTPDYNQSSNPSHTALAIPTDCASCHTTDAWQPASFSIHNNYYALNGAHAAVANDCAKCHNGDYNNTPNTCAGCHIADFNQTTNPGHVAAQFSTDCASCHSETAWAPATFDHDGMYFPIYSGKHKGEWDQCADCHTNPSNYAEFTCTTCHTNPETTNQHNGINGFSYNSPACLACHPTGSATDGFNHNNTGFPLTGAHITTACISCHASGYAGTPTDCASCHTQDYNQSTNPNHVSLAIPTNCASCHTTDAWEPATFPIHNNYYQLKGAHAAIANDCAKCHNGDYNNTPNTCAGCHMADYNQTNNPNHATVGFPTTCQDCHSETAWTPANFNHDGMYFPIYSGKHKNKWDQCSDCHITPGNYAVFSCTVCHTNPQTNNHHQGVGGYVYNSPACLSCHPNGD